MASRVSSSFTAVPQRPARVLLVAILAASVLLTGCLFSPAKTRAARGMELALQDDATFLVGGKRVPRERAFTYARQLGVTRLRVNLLWAYTMPADVYTARRKPAKIQYLFDSIDTLVDEAADHGIRVHLSLTGPAPRWARPKSSIRQAWYKPSSREFGKWAGVVAEHFAGRVDRYSIWNEPNWVGWLAPLKSGASQYRGLYSRGYAAIKKADPKAKVFIGETAPYQRRGLSTAPIAFLRSLACVNTRYKRVHKCTKLKADGYAHHPYDFTHSPRFKRPGADNVSMGTLSRLTRALDRLSHSGQLRRNGGGKLGIYLNEFGFFSSGHRALPRATRGKYMGDGFKIALANGRVKSMLQYLLVQPPKHDPGVDFNLALISGGKKQPQYTALQHFFKKYKSRLKRPGGAISLPPPGSP
jgi:hypothetical protein